jgi:hypothetical protein
MNPTRVWRDNAGDWHMTCEAPCCTHTTCDDQAMAFEAALGHVAYWHRMLEPDRCDWCNGTGYWYSAMCLACSGTGGVVIEGHHARATGPRNAAQSPGEWLGHRDEARAQGGTW